MEAKASKLMICCKHVQVLGGFSMNVNTHTNEQPQFLVLAPSSFQSFMKD